MRPLTRYLPEPIKKPLRTIRSRVQGTLMKQVFRKEMTVAQLNRLFRLHRYWYVATYADNQLISRHNCDFMTDERFLKGHRFAQQMTAQERPMWSAYLLQWAARQAVTVEGDFVECGTARGFAAASIVASLDWQRHHKRFFLFDSWEGLLNGQLTDYERTVLYGRGLDGVNQSYTGYYEEVQRAFSSFPSVVFIKGYVPESLSRVEIPTVAFLHLDMNAVYPEVEALRHFWPRLSRGAWVVLDDYGQPGRGEQKQGMDRLVEELGCEIFASPTGQGLIIKS
ncbi:MAG: class I SAM-dependent methyltransferase [Candidatus Omnitrophica bacterium]|nr:class I SAM-dependent methyltransferase [Candidatus Omnitrophota bacterium]